MQQNIGTRDRIIRITGGLGLIAAAALGFIGIWGYLGVIPLATALIGVCPAYLPFGVSTCPIAPDKK